MASPFWYGEAGSNQNRILSIIDHVGEDIRIVAKLMLSPHYADAEHVPAEADEWVVQDDEAAIPNNIKNAVVAYVNRELDVRKLSKLHRLQYAVTLACTLASGGIIFADHCPRFIAELLLHMLPAIGWRPPEDLTRWLAFIDHIDLDAKLPLKRSIDSVVVASIRDGHRFGWIS